MTIIEKIKLFFAAKKILNNVRTEAVKMNTTNGKPGWQTSEFYLNMATQIGVLWGAVAGFVPPKWAALITIGGTAVYTVARTIAKAVSDIQAAKATSTTVSTTAPVTTISTPG